MHQIITRHGGVITKLFGIAVWYVVMIVATGIGSYVCAQRERDTVPLQVPAMHRTRHRARPREPEPKLRSATQPQPKDSLPSSSLSQDQKKADSTSQSKVRSAPLATTRSNESTAATNGSLRIDVPDRVEVGTPFEMDVWVDLDNPAKTENVDVYMEQTRKVRYEPRNFQIKPGTRKTIRVTILKATSGLAMIRGSANGVYTLEEPVDAGFTAKIRATNVDQPLMSGRTASIRFDFVNGQGQPIAVDAPLRLTLECPGLYFRAKPTDNWDDGLKIDVPENSTSTQPIQVRPRWLWSPESASLIVRTEIADAAGYSFVVRDEAVVFNQVPQWWLPLAMAIVGGIVFSFYQGTQDWMKSTDPKRTRTLSILVTRVLPGSLAGALAYFLVNMNVLGIKIDTTQLQGFVVLGFLFAYVGIDTILKLVTKKSEEKQNKPNDQQVAAPTAP